MSVQKQKISERLRLIQRQVNALLDELEADVEDQLIIQKVIDVVCEVYFLKPASILHGKHQDKSDARKIIAHELHQMGYSDAVIAKSLNRERSSVLYMRRAFNDMLVNEDFKSQVDLVQRKLAQQE
jgi:chromosomal replication initiation ATPase DnaA